MGYSFFSSKVMIHVYLLQGLRESWFSKRSLCQPFCSLHERDKKISIHYTTYLNFPADFISLCKSLKLFKSHDNGIRPKTKSGASLRSYCMDQLFKDILEQGSVRYVGMAHPAPPTNTKFSTNPTSGGSL